MAKKFNYDQAFNRNIGWVTELEQHQLASKKIAIAGMGGVGGIHLLTLARLGICNFHIADFDIFEIQNFNRQVGATMSTIGESKVEVMSKLVKDINPAINLKVFEEGVNQKNILEFLEGVDLYVDGVDFFEIDVREIIFKQCYELGIPAITAAPTGMATSYLVFLPKKMSFEQYFQLANLTQEEKRVNFLLGLCPTPLPLKYQVDPSTVDFKNKRGPSTIMACNLCAAVIAVEALKILLNRGKVYYAPHYQIFDSYLQRFKRGYLFWGNRNPLQRLKIAIAKKKLLKVFEPKPEIFSINTSNSVLERILDIARWAPSGDNSQPWRFEIQDESHVIIRVKDNSDEDLYDFDGIPTHISTGILLETLRIAASNFNLAIQWHYEKVSQHEFLLKVVFSLESKNKDALYDFIFHRSVDRRCYRKIPLTSKEKQQLTSAINSDFELTWFESFEDRLKIAKINALSTHVRLQIPELYHIHKSVIDLEHRYSENGIPVEALGLNPLSKALYRWSFQSWKRQNFMNRYFGVPFFAGLELDILPGIYSSGYFMLRTNLSIYSQPEALLKLGMSLQRFWLTATKIGLVMQPAYSSIIFSYYLNHQRKFTDNDHIISKANKLVQQLKALPGSGEIVFIGRIGWPAKMGLPTRSVRKPLKDILV